MEPVSRWLRDRVRKLKCSTIHGMVFNALKLFMEINPELFQQCQDNYKAQRRA